MGVYTSTSYEGTSSRVTPKRLLEECILPICCSLNLQLEADARMYAHVSLCIALVHTSILVQAEHKKVYIPRRLEEIEEEEAKLQDRMSAFNSKIKDKEIKEL